MPRRFEHLDVEFTRGLKFEKDVEVRDSNGSPVPVALIKSFVAVVKASDFLDGTTLLTFAVEVLDDVDTKILLTASETATASFSPMRTAGYFFLYYVDQNDEIFPLHRGKLIVK